MEIYVIKFKREEKVFKYTVAATGIVPAIEEAVHRHFEKVGLDAAYYDIISAVMVEG